MMVGDKARGVSSLFTAHPASVDETYLEHLAVAAGFGARMVAGGMACLVHGLLPVLFRSTGSAIIEDLHRRMVVQRQRRAEPMGAGPTAERQVASGE